MVVVGSEGAREVEEVDEILFSELWEIMCGGDTTPPKKTSSWWSADGVLLNTFNLEDQVKNCLKEDESKQGKDS